MKHFKIMISIVVMLAFIMGLQIMYADDTAKKSSSTVTSTETKTKAEPTNKTKKRKMMNEEWWWDTKVGLIMGLNLVTAQTDTSSSFKLTPAIGLAAENNLLNFGKFDVGGGINILYTVKGYDVDYATIRADFISIPIIFKGRYLHDTGDGIDIGFGKIIPGGIIGFDNTLFLSAEVAPENTSDTYIYKNTSGFTLGLLIGPSIDYKWPLPGEFSMDIRFAMDLMGAGKDGYTIPLQNVPEISAKAHPVVIGKTKQMGFNFYLSYKIGLDFFKPK